MNSTPWKNKRLLLRIASVTLVSLLGISILGGCRGGASSSGSGVSSASGISRTEDGTDISSADLTSGSGQGDLSSQPGSDQEISDPSGLDSSGTLSSGISVKSSAGSASGSKAGTSGGSSSGSIQKPQGQVLLNGKSSVSWTSGKENTISLSVANTGSFNYFTISYSSDIPLKCTLGYTAGGKGKEEIFFLEAGKNLTFSSYVNAFSPAQTGTVNFLKTTGKITVSGSTSNISQFTLASKPALNKVVYVSNGKIKIGAKLDWGGGLSYYENLTDQVALYEKAGKKFIKTNGSKLDGGTLLTKTVNLLNSCDTGRLLQQSYYGIGTAPYEPAMYMNSKWSFNPVQGGDQYGNKSKIVDVKVTGNSIYVKCQPMDWAQKNQLTETYMEATYTLDGYYMFVENRFTDFTGYTHPLANQELPALYVGEPLRVFAYYGGTSPFTGSGTITKRDDLYFWADNYTAHTFRTTENWSAWITEDNWGLGLYVPGVKTMLSGRFDRDTQYDELPETASPVNYTAATQVLKLKSFTPLVYRYMMVSGPLDQIRSGITRNKDKISNTELLSFRK